MPRVERTISDVVREIMAALPEVEEFVSHGRRRFALAVGRCLPRTRLITMATGGWRSG
jgi:hypothetical protein